MSNPKKGKPMTIDWEDVTSYRRGERGTVAPKAWELRGKASGIRIVVHRCLGCGDTWFLCCPALRLETVKLEAKELEDAQREAIDKVSSKLSVIVKDVADLARL